MDFVKGRVVTGALGALLGAFLGVLINIFIQWGGHRWGIPQTLGWTNVVQCSAVTCGLIGLVFGESVGSVLGYAIDFVWSLITRGSSRTR
ncbi:hypothetical protein SAMN05216567_12416 [Variovorax sp. OK605]|jgi:hypothetical protein|uniref:hypothetical protein n=1 Tax=unclassified Variovorax TaxID=663243 RepID=UPI0008ADADFF|nr:MULTISPECIES: hypothetical protein [unclassified Variovorax]SEK13789.1 hypothetical protein SAMN05518853_11379 [Variovorax sp. OK202]SFD91730.1 hypothetical protein SAMN05444746_11379 [Variovorax sp. OK212]SFQ65230.1 hypothetical protein SAMN05216567_12416 [Variovorax sp. OK605]